MQDTDQPDSDRRKWPRTLLEKLVMILVLLYATAVAVGYFFNINVTVVAVTSLISWLVELFR